MRVVFVDYKVDVVISHYGDVTVCTIYNDILYTTIQGLGEIKASARCKANHALHQLCWYARAFACIEENTL